MWAQNAEFPENNLTSLELSQKWFWSFFANGSSYRGKTDSTFLFFMLLKTIIQAHQQVLKFIKVGPFAQLPCNGDIYINKKCVNFQGQWCIQIMIWKSIFLKCYSLWFPMQGDAVWWVFPGTFSMSVICNISCIIHCEKTAL